MQQLVQSKGTDISRWLRQKSKMTS